MGISVVIRADANRQVGYGHLGRCVALAQAAKADGAEVIFVSQCDSDGLRSTIRGEGFDILSVESGTDARATLEHAVESLPESTWVVLDSYEFERDLVPRLQRAGRKVLLFDDEGKRHSYSANIVLNQNVGAEGLTYRAPPSSQLLRGSRFALVRQEFLDAAPKRRPRKSIPQEILLSLGGSHRTHCLHRLVEAIASVWPSSVAVAVAGGNIEDDARRIAEELSPGICVRPIGEPERMASLMANADLGVIGGGTTCWEMAYMGVPFLAVVLADNQARIVEELVQRGVALSLGTDRELTSESASQQFARVIGQPDLLDDMRAKGRELVDGHGGARVSMWLHERRLWLRPVDTEDGELLWRWANDEETRAQSFSSEMIPWDDHEKWMDERLNNSNCKLWIAVDPCEAPIGQIRFDRAGDVARVSVSISPEHRGRGYASELIRIASERILRECWARAVLAEIKATNRRSIAAFSAAGFDVDGTQTTEDRNVEVVVLKGG